MSINTAFLDASPVTHHNFEAVMLQTLGRILRLGTLSADDAETLATVANDRNIDQTGRFFAGRSLRWLAQQAAMVSTPIWEPSSNVRH